MIDWRDLRGPLRQVLKGHGVAEERLGPAVAEVEATLRARVERLAEAELETARTELQRMEIRVARERDGLRAEMEAKLAQQVEALGFAGEVGQATITLLVAFSDAMLGGAMLRESRGTGGGHAGPPIHDAG